MIICGLESSCYLLSKFYSISHSNQMITCAVLKFLALGEGCVESHISKRTDCKLLDLFDVFNTFYTQ